MVEAKDAITIDPEVQHGTPCFTGTRVPVQSLFDALTHGRTVDAFLEQFPTVQRDHALAVLQDAAWRVGHQHDDTRAA